MTLPVLSFSGSPAAGTLPVSLDQLMVGGLLLQAASGGGKSRAIRQLLEETHGRVQHFVIDPEGEFASLREKFDYVLAAPHGGDVVATTKTARVLCRRLVEIGASAVLDIYDLPSHEKREFVRLFLEELMALPRAMWKPILIVVDEADFFAPEKSESVTTAAIIDVNGRGRKRGYRLVLTTRRLSKLNKDVADLQNRMIGQTGLDLDVKRAGDELGMDKEARAQLPRLNPGTFFVYGPAISRTPVMARTAEKTLTSHPEAGKVGKVAPPAPAKIRALVAQLADLPKEAEEEARTQEELRARLATAERRVKQLERGGAERVVEKSVPDAAAIARAVEKAVADERNRQQRQLRAFVGALKPIGQKFARVTALMGEVQGVIEGVISEAEQGWTGITPSGNTEDSRAAVQVGHPRGSAREASNGSSALPVTGAIRPSVSAVGQSSRAPARPIATPAAGGLNRGKQRILDSLAELKAIGIDQPSRTQLSIVANLNLTGGSGSTYVGELTTAGLVEIPEPGKLQITAAGERLAAPVTVALTNEEVQRRALSRLNAGERRILEYLISLGPDASVSRADAGRAVGLNLTGGSGSTYVGKLSTLDFVVIPRPGMLAVGPLLFPEG